MIGLLAHESAARAFGDHLVTLGMPCMVEESREGWAIWVERDDHLERAKAELDAFARNPDDPRYAAAAGEASAIRSKQAREEQRRRENYIDVRTRGLTRAGGIPLTIILIALSLVVGVATRLGSNRPVASYFSIEPLVPSAGGEEASGPLAAVRQGQVWRLITPIFLHFDPFHILFNLLWLADLGAMIERRKSTWFLLVLVLASALISNLAQYMGSGAGFGGMSGVVYALFGYAWMKGRYQPQEGVGVMETTVWIMLIWLGLGYVMPGMRVANTAHLVGLVVGVIFGAGPHFWARFRRTMRQRADGA